MFMGREPRTKWGLLDVKRMRQESARLMSEHMGFTSAAVHPDNVVDDHVGRREAGRRHHPRAATSTPSSSSSTSRPWACR